MTKGKHLEKTPNLNMPATQKLKQAYHFWISSFVLFTTCIFWLNKKYDQCNVPLLVNFWAENFQLCDVSFLWPAQCIARFRTLRDKSFRMESSQTWATWTQTLRTTGSICTAAEAHATWRPTWPLPKEFRTPIRTKSQTLVEKGHQHWCQLVFFGYLWYMLTSGTFSLQLSHVTTYQR